MCYNYLCCHGRVVWEFSSAGRASALQAGCHRFEPCNSHQHISMMLPLFKVKTFAKNGPVVQLVRTPACHARGRGFEPHPGRHFFKTTDAFVAQSVEQGTENPCVGGSIPPEGTNFCGSGSVVERHLAKVNVASSNLVFRSKHKRRFS